MISRAKISTVRRLSSLSLASRPGWAGAAGPAGGTCCLALLESLLSPTRRHTAARRADLDRGRRGTRGGIELGFRVGPCCKPVGRRDGSATAAPGRAALHPPTRIPSALRRAARHFCKLGAMGSCRPAPAPCAGGRAQATSPGRCPWGACVHPASRKQWKCCDRHPRRRNRAGTGGSRLTLAGPVRVTKYSIYVCCQIQHLCLFE